jgi:hypothetical protein
MTQYAPFQSREFFCFIMIETLELAPYTPEEIQEEVVRGKMDLLTKIASHIACNCGKCVLEAEREAVLNGIGISELPSVNQARDLLGLSTRDKPKEPDSYIPPITYKDEITNQVFVVFTNQDSHLRKYTKPTTDQQEAFEKWDQKRKEAAHHGVNLHPKREVNNTCPAWQLISVNELVPEVVDYAKFARTGDIIIPAKIALEHNIGSTSQEKKT